MDFGALWMFLLPALALSVIAVALTGLGLRRGARVLGAESGPKREMRIYADQLREVERDQAKGLVSEDEAQRLRAETARRLLDADKTAQVALSESPPSMKIVALVLVLLMPIGAGVFYWIEGAPLYQDMPLAQRFAEAQQIRAERPSQTQLETAWEASPNRPQPPQVDANYTQLMTQLRAALVEQPDDLRGHRLLATNEANIGNFADSAAAWVRVIEIQGTSAPVTDMIALAETMVQAAGGIVSPQAEVVLERVLQQDPTNGPARYYLGLSLGQTGRPDLTFRLWRGLLEDSGPTDPWVPIIRGEIEQLAEIAGVRYTLQPLATQGLRGPSAEDMAAAADMSAQERQDMIGGMVEGLAARLANQGGTPEEWARLIGALGTLGQTERARAIWAEGRLIFADQPEALSLLQAAAAPLGGTE